MRRDQLEHAIRTACQIIEQPEVIVVGSQAILGTYDESELPAAATMSIGVDILPISDSDDETARLAVLIEGVAGEFSPFQELHGFSIDGVDLETAVLPDDWRDRLVKVQNANTAARPRRRIPRPADSGEHERGAGLAPGGSQGGTQRESDDSGPQPREQADADGEQGVEPGAVLEEAKRLVAEGAIGREGAAQAGPQCHGDRLRHLT